jgi:hypothetical protein
VHRNRSVAPESSVAAATASSRAAAHRLLGALASALLLSLVLALASAAIARADVPSAAYSIADTNLVASPDGGFSYVVWLRDSADQPLPGATVVLDFTNAAGIQLCGSQDTDHDGRLLATTDISGKATFQVKAGGSTTGRATVGSGIDVIALVRPRTTDLDGDSDVDAQDQAALNALVGTAGPKGDLDRNGIVDAADVALLAAHVGGNCITVPAFQPSWGSLKARYR